MAPTEAPRINVDVDRYRRDQNVTVLRLSDVTGIARTSLRRKLARPGLFTIDEMNIVAAALDIPAHAFEVAS